jgi:glycosyltransferase involved in cell wall biosynthesis
MLVKGSLRHDARVRKTATSLQESGYEVFVLGSTRQGVDPEPSWRKVDGFALQVVPLRGRPPGRRERAAAWRATRLRARCGRLRERLDRLAADAPRPAAILRIRRRLLIRQLERTRRRADSVRRRERELRAGAKAARVRRDPHNFGLYEAGWWPLVRELKPDVVHVHDVAGLSTARRAARRGARWIYDAHEPKRHWGETGEEAARRRQVAELASEADAVISTTAPLGEILIQELGLPGMPALVHNAPPLRVGPAPQPGLRDAAGVADDDPLLVYSGVMTRHRRVEVVLEAMTMLPAVQLALVVGANDPVTKELLERADALGVAARVHIVQKVPPESVVPFVAEADVGLIPFNRTPGQDMALPNKLFEYLHAGLPMVVSDALAIADFVRRHELGVVAPVDAAAAWAEGIDRMLAEPRYRDRVSEWEQLRREWSWERQAETLLGVYRDLLGNDLPDGGGPAPVPLESARSR